MPAGEATRSEISITLKDDFYKGWLRPDTVLGGQGAAQR